MLTIDLITLSLHREAILKRSFANSERITDTVIRAVDEYIQKSY